VHVTFNTAEFGDLHATFQWNSGDVNYDVDTGAFLQTATPSPSPPATAQPAPTLSASATPARLPRSGGAPQNDGLPLAEIAAAVIAISAVVAVSLIALRRRVEE
jgi:hypothetical protein